MNNDLISRAEAIDVIRSMTISLGGKEIFHPEAKKSVIGVLGDLAAIDAEPVRHGRWIQNRNVPSYHSCSCCNRAHNMPKSCNVYVLPYYCMYCGAKMDGEKDAFD